jgi:hypothetical protein
MIIGEPKTAKGRRRVDLPEIAIRALKEHRERMLAEENHRDWIFCTTKGDPIKKNSFRKSSFLPLLKASGLYPKFVSMIYVILQQRCFFRRGFTQKLLKND